VTTAKQVSFTPIPVEVALFETSSPYWLIEPCYKYHKPSQIGAQKNLLFIKPRKIYRLQNFKEVKYVKKEVEVKVYSRDAVS
jgi:hypothetical protein